MELTQMRAVRDNRREQPHKNAKRFKTSRANRKFLKWSVEISIEKERKTLILSNGISEKKVLFPNLAL